MVTKDENERVFQEPVFFKAINDTTDLAVNHGLAVMVSGVSVAEGGGVGMVGVELDFGRVGGGLFILHQALLEVKGAFV